MRKLVLTVPEVAFIAATRGALGFGAGLLLSEKFSESRRHKVGLGLLAFGIATTIPAARKLFGRRAELSAEGFVQGETHADPGRVEGVNQQRGDRASRL